MSHGKTNEKHHKHHSHRAQTINDPFESAIQVKV